MPAQIIDLITTPILLRITTEDNPVGQETDDFGNLVDIYRIRQIQIDNTSGVVWQAVIYRDGIPIHTQEITATMQQVFTIASNRRFDLNRYSVSFTRV